MATCHTTAYQGSHLCSISALHSTPDHACMQLHASACKRKQWLRHLASIKSLFNDQAIRSLPCMLAGVQYTGHERPVTSLCMLQPHSTCTVASCDESGAIHLWSTATGMQLAVFKETTGMLSSGAGTVRTATALPTCPQGMTWIRVRDRADVSVCGCNTVCHYIRPIATSCC